ncbi:hypothetical protein CYMTET_29034 [Cymbomonas tetramitiformis]|uniref:Uncharacterized protein n=1 Tax=Cymbomonas tetramitiformis TaxID=36881 RepID=A0AAE0FLS4_9CHLO|nr:hypothetical protein CYMTET_29034 [Cymbomonas tetramitiformis]
MTCTQLAKHHQVERGDVGALLCGLGQNVPEVYNAVGVVVRRLNPAAAFTKASHRSQLGRWVLGSTVSERMPALIDLGPVSHAIGVGHTLDLVAESLKGVAAVGGMGVRAFVIYRKRVSTKGVGHEAEEDLVHSDVK